MNQQSVQAVPEGLATQIYRQHGIEPTVAERQSGFWYCVWKYNLPITLTEGAKKAACLLSHGEIAVALPGVWNGLRSQDAKGRAVRPHLIPELQVFATAGRTVTLSFDHDTRPKTIAQVRQALYRTGLLLRREDCHVQIRSLPGPEKGVDDFVALRGYEALAQQARLQRLRVKEVLQKVRQIQLG